MGRPVYFFTRQGTTTLSCSKNRIVDLEYTILLVITLVKLVNKRPVLQVCSSNNIYIPKLNGRRGSAFRLLPCFDDARYTEKRNVFTS